jgi:hypothetical protein
MLFHVMRDHEFQKGVGDENRAVRESDWHFEGHGQGPSTTRNIQYNEDRNKQRSSGSDETQERDVLKFTLQATSKTDADLQ